VIKFSKELSHHLFFGIIWSISNCTNGGFLQQYLQQKPSLSKIENLNFGVIVFIITKLKKEYNAGLAFPNIILFLKFASPL